MDRNQYYKAPEHPTNKWLKDPFYGGFKFEKHLVVTGTILFQNSDGYLSADQSSHITLSWFSLLFYVCFLLWWVIQMRFFKEQVIIIHWMILTLLVLGAVQSFFSVLFYMILHGIPGSKGGPLVLFIMMVDVGKSTYARVALLKVALGQYTVLKSLSKYDVKIGLLSLLYAFSLAVSLMVEKWRQQYHILGFINFILSQPVYLFNLIFVFWIF